MPIIEISFKGKKVQDYPIIIGESCTIGRKKANDIVIENLSVSGFHAQIDSVSTTFVIRDLDSTNGTYINNQKKSIHNLKHKDLILIGKHELLFDCTDLIKMKSNGSHLYDDAETRILDSNELKKYSGQTTEVKEETLHNEDQENAKVGKAKTSIWARVFERFFK